MRLYTNTRLWRSQMLLWLFVVAGVGFTLLAVYAFSTDNMPGFQVAAIMGGFILLCAIGMEFYCRRTVAALDLEDGLLVVHSRSLFGPHLNRGTATLGKAQTDTVRVWRRESISEMQRIISTGAQNHYHLMKIGPQATTYILDVTADEEAGDRIADVLRKRPELSRGT